MQPLNHVLLVEDNAIARQVAKTTIAQHGCQVVTASNAAEATALLNKQTFVLIFMDVGLPDGDGFEISKQIRQTPDCPNYHTPIVVVTAHLTSADDQRHCYEAGINHVITKPLSMEKVNIAMQFMQEAVHLPIFDLKQAVAFHRDEATAIAVLRLFVDALVPVRQQLIDLYQAKDWRTLRKVIHREHGAGAYCGTLRLNHSFAKMQEALTTTPINRDKLNHCCAEMLQHIDELVAFVATLPSFSSS